MQSSHFFTRLTNFKGFLDTDEYSLTITQPRLFIAIKKTFLEDDIGAYPEYLTLINNLALSS